MSGFVHSTSAIIIGFICTIVSFIWVEYLKEKFRIDDTLDVFATPQAIPGAIGTICIGIFSDFEDTYGIFYGGSFKFLLRNKIFAVVLVIIYTFIMTYILINYIKKLVGVTVSPEYELEGFRYVTNG